MTSIKPTELKCNLGSVISGVKRDYSYLFLDMLAHTLEFIAVSNFMRRHQFGSVTT